MNELQRSLGRIEGKLDQSISMFNKLEQRVDRVELQMNANTTQLHRYAGALAVLVVIFGVLKGAFVKFLEGI